MKLKFIPGIALLFLISSSCNNPNNKQDSDSYKNSLTEHQIGKLSYYISLPADYTIKETEGPDFSVYYFSPTDTTDTIGLSGGMYFGNFPHEFDPPDDSCKSEVMKGKILDESRDWTVYSCSDKYLIQTIANNKNNEGWNERIHAFGDASHESDLEKILVIFSTLKNKNSKKLK